MDGILMNALHGNLNQLSDKSLKKLIGYFATGSLSLPDHYLLLSEIIGPKAMLKVLKVPDSNSSTLHQETI
tara:strand:- start:327 stop:539 length:213 start_codon:yes stop_codon:yes gene_type:complete